MGNKYGKIDCETCPDLYADSDSGYYVCKKNGKDLAYWPESAPRVAKEDCPRCTRIIRSFIYIGKAIKKAEADLKKLIDIWWYRN